MSRAFDVLVKAVGERETRERLRPDLLLSADLKVALRKDGCPLCRLLRDADRYYLKVFLREGKDDGRMILRLLGSWGLCARHADALVHMEPVEHGDGLGTGTLYDWLLDQARKRLGDLRAFLGANEMEDSARWSRRRRPRRQVEHALRRLRRTTSCPACEAQQEHAPYVAEQFVRALEPASGVPQVVKFYLASDGLCLPHWRAVRDLGPSSDVRDLIEGKQRQVVASMRAALDDELASTAGERPTVTRAQDLPASLRALAMVAGETSWHPPEG